MIIIIINLLHLNLHFKRSRQVALLIWFLDSQIRAVLLAFFTPTNYHNYLASIFMQLVSLVGGFLLVGVPSDQGGGVLYQAELRRWKDTLIKYWLFYIYKL